MFERFRERLERPRERDPEKEFRIAAIQLHLACRRKYRQPNPTTYVVNRLRIPGHETGLVLLQKEIFGWSISARGDIPIDQTTALAAADVELRSGKQYPNGYISGQVSFGPADPEFPEPFREKFGLSEEHDEVGMIVAEDNLETVQMLTSLVRAARHQPRQPRLPGPMGI